MANKPKQFHEGYWYHVYTRSQPELRLFGTDEERNWFLETLDSIFTRRNVGLGAFCLMGTHYHALVRMGSVRLDRALNGLHMSYARYVNETRDRRGSVFEKHPGTDIILDDRYLLQVVPYIHKNPVKAGIVDDPRNYKWHTDNKYRSGKFDSWEFDCWTWPPHFEGENRRRIYQERMREQTDVPRKGEGYIGDEEDWSRLAKRKEDRADRYRDRRKRPSMESIVRDLAHQNDREVADLKKPGRSQPETAIRQKAMVKLYEEGYGPTEIGEYFGRSKSTVMYAVREKMDN